MEEPKNLDAIMKKTAQRRSRILGILEQKGQVNVIELSQEMGVSEVTIRNDLANLERKKMLIRAHGGAFKPQHLTLPVMKNKKINLEQKRKIGKKAIAQIKRCYYPGFGFHYF